MRRKEADVVKTVTAGGRRLRVAVRPGTGGGPPLLVCNGIGTPLEALEPFTAALVNPADSKKSRYQASDDVSADAEAWQQAAATEQGSWWPDYASWLAARSGGQVAAPAGLGGDGYRVIEPAPGSYVRAA